MYVKTERLELKPICQAGLENLTELVMDDVVKQTYMLPDFASREEALQLAKRIQTLSQDPGRYVVGIYRDGVLLGMMNDVEVTPDAIEMGYALLPRYFNQGYCTEALKGMIDYLLSHGFAKVVTGAFSGNGASLRVMEKSGMTRLEHTDEIAYRGKTHRCIYYMATKKCNPQQAG